MITVSIGGMPVPIEKASEGWISQMIEEARRRGMALCVQVQINTPDANVGLSTPGCGGSFGGGRPPNDRERKIIDAWNRRHLGNGQLNPGELRAFLNELTRLT